MSRETFRERMERAGLSVLFLAEHDARTGRAMDHRLARAEERADADAMPVEQDYPRSAWEIDEPER